MAVHQLGGAQQGDHILLLLQLLSQLLELFRLGAAPAQLLVFRRRPQLIIDVPERRAKSTSLRDLLGL